MVGMPARAEAEAWARRRSRYEAWLREPGAFVLLAERGGDLLGFALITIGSGYDGWASGVEIGEIRDLAVLPGEHGAGIGTKLLERVAAELADAGIDHYRLTVLAGNVDAIRFYERHGLTTVVQQMLGPTH
jgi:GNAT superfamily N-acetyltransferase